MDYAISFKHSTGVLELGGGDVPLCNRDGKRFTVNMDIRSGETVDIAHDIRKIPWPVEDASFGGVFARYVLEHVPYRELEGVVKEIYRVLMPGGKLIFFVPNITEQCKLALKWGAGDRTSEMLYGSQELEGDLGCHKSAFDEKYIKELLKDFKFIRMCPHPGAPSDLIVEAYKLGEDVFEREYFDDGTYGYLNYRNFATHYTTSRIIMDNKPKSLIDIGGGRGYLVRILENQGVRAACMDISKNAWHNRATAQFILHDARDIPWPFKDKAFQIGFSINFLEHIEEEHLDGLIRESVRVSERGLHGIHFSESPFKEEDEDLDITHRTLKDENWWVDKFKKIAPDYPDRIVHPRILEYEVPERNPPVSHMPPPPDDKIKLNLGSFLDMFYFWVNIDIINLSEFAQSQKYNFKQLDVTKGLPYKDNEVDFIISNHLIEHLSRDEGKNLLKECQRVLKPEGIIRLSTPDTKKLTKDYLDGKIFDYKVMNVGVEKAKDDAEAYYNLLLEGHKTIYDEVSLGNMLKDAGFKILPSVTPFNSNHEIFTKQTLTTHPSLSVVLESQKK